MRSFGIFLGNFIWFCLSGAFVALLLFLIGIVCCMTLVFIPFGREFMKLAGLVAAPFGKTVENSFDDHPYLNILWMLVDFYALFTMLVGIVLCATIILIPFGKQCFKIAKLAAAPFGAVVLKDF